MTRLLWLLPLALLHPGRAEARSALRLGGPGLACRLCLAAAPGEPPPSAPNEAPPDLRPAPPRPAPAPADKSPAPGVTGVSAGLLGCGCGVLVGAGAVVVVIAGAVGFVLWILSGQKLGGAVAPAWPGGPPGALLTF